MDLDNLKIRPTIIAAFLALMPWVVANMYLTIVVNWPGMREQLHTLNIEDMHRIGALNFFFCMYTVGVIAVMIADRYMKFGSLFTHCFLIFGFMVGIGIVYAVAYALQGVVSRYINGAIMVDSLLALYGLFMFYVDVITRWHNRNSEDKSHTTISTY